MNRNRTRPSPSALGSQGRRLFWGMLVVTGLALLVRVIVLVQLHDHPLLQPHGEMDSGVYLDLARRVAGGEILAGDRVFFVSPFYVYFVASVLSLAGSSVLAVQLAQVLLGSAAAWLVMATAEAWYGSRAALVAGALAAFTGYFAFNETLILQSAVDPFLSALELWLLARAWLHGRTRTWLAAGVALGVHVLNRPNMIIWAAVTLVCVAARSPLARLLGRPARPAAARGGSDGRPAPGRDLVAAGALACGLVVALSPVAARNFVVAGQFALISSHGGLNFYIGNNAEADGTYRMVTGVTPSIVGQDRDARRVAERATGRTMSDAQASSWFFEQAWAWMANHPGRAAELFARKIAYMLNAADLPLNFSYAYYSRDEDTLLRWLAVGPWLLLPLGLAGLWLGRPSGVSPGSRGAAEQTLAWLGWSAFVPVYVVSVAVFFVAGRYRLPLLPALCATGAGALEALARRWRSGGWRWRGQAMGLLALLGVFANWNLGLDDGRAGERTEMILHEIDTYQDAAADALLARTEPDHPDPAILLYRAGQAYLERHEAGRGIPLLERALRLARDRAEIHLALGEALLDAGRAADAIPHLRAALRAGNRPDLAAFDLARALAATGARQEALAALREMPPPERLDVASQAAVGRLALDLGDAALARTFLERAVQSAPGDAAAQESLGLALGLLGRRADAIAALALACQLAPGNATARLNLAVAYANDGRLREAREQAHEALRLEPDYAQARALIAQLDRLRK